MTSPLYIIIYIGLLSVLLSCTHSSSHYPRYGKFPEERTVSVQEIRMDTLFFRFPYRIVIKDSLAVLLDLHNETHYLYAFHYPDWQPIAPFGKRGEGPDELLLADRVRLCASDSIWVLDSNRMRITQWKLFAEEKRITPVETICLDTRLIRVLDFFPTDSGFFVTDYTGNYRLHELDIRGNIRRSLGSIPTENEELHGDALALAQAWRSFIGYNPKNGILALATQLGEVLEIQNRKGNFSIVRYGPNGEPIFSTQRGGAFPEGIKGFNEIQVTDCRIYTVFDGISFKERMLQERTGKSLPKGGTLLYVFDLQGNPLRCYHLDRSIFGIHVDEQRGIVIATTTDTDNPLLQFSLQ